MNDIIERLKEEWNLDEHAIYLEPCEDYNKGIVGVTEDKQRIIYSYQKLTAALAESYQKTEENSEKTFEDYLDEACEWVDCNTIRSIPYWNKEYAPIIMYEVE